ncbi:hypothetical protein A6R68_10232 [Neotoma lepida]|uniref:glyceraldehyde-3-phosphate dehydrogenase (phosphorylating) n=1 Tax=Neotoma lepida TaxID=56216 RepID=A0A1A6FXJ0_NEOLE|nr:hypothetical protein A6R68_10232 [Neotoma lepida]
MMVKFAVNRFGRIGPLVTGASFMSGKVDVFAINGPFINLSYIVYMVQYDSTHGKFNSTVKAENRKLVIHDNFGIVEGLIMTVHAIPYTQKTVGGHSGKLWCYGHGATQSITPTSLVLRSVSTTALTCCLEKAIKYDDIKKMVKQALKGPLKGILGYDEDQVVSCDLNNDPHSSTFGAVW